MELGPFLLIRKDTMQHLEDQIKADKEEYAALERLMRIKGVKMSDILTGRAHIRWNPKHMPRVKVHGLAVIK